MSRTRIKSSGMTRQAYFIISRGLMILVAVMQMPVGGAAAGVQVGADEEQADHTCGTHTDQVGEALEHGHDEDNDD